MLRLIVSLLLVVGTAFAQSGNFDVQKFKKEAGPLEGMIDEAISSSADALFQRAKATYLGGYGIVLTLECALDSPRNPFSTPKPVDPRRTAEKRKEIRQKLVELLKQRVTGLDILAPTESLAVVVHLMNTNPADMPNLPTQLIVAVKKQDAADFQAGKIQASDLSARINVREF